MNFIWATFAVSFSYKKSLLKTPIFVLIHTTVPVPSTESDETTAWIILKSLIV